MQQFLQITDQYLSYHFFSKILETLVYNRLIEFINENGLLYIFQFSFQKGKSTSMALVTLIDKITEALDKGRMHHWWYSRLFQGFWHSWSWYIITKKWNYMVYKISQSNGLKIIYQIEFNT